MSGYRVLVVEHQLAVRRTLARVLTDAGHIVVLASGAEEACAALRIRGVDLVLMDLGVPGLAGRTLYHLVTSQWPDLTRRIVVMSGDPEAPEQADWIAANRLPVLPKPFELERLLALVADRGGRRAARTS